MQRFSQPIHSCSEMDDGKTEDLADRRLVEAFLESRTQRSFAGLYERHARPVYLFALRLCGGRPSLAEEIVQESWVRAIERLPEFCWRSTLRTWLIGFVNCWREQNRLEIRNGAPIDSVIDGSVLPHRASADSGGAVDLERAIVRLAPGYREILLLHDVEGYTHSEIGRMMGIDEGTSKSQLSRARRTMRGFLREDRGRRDERKE